MGIVSWLVLGLIVGILAKWIMPGKDGGGCLLTTGLGVAGAFLGGFIASLLGLGSLNGLTLWSVLISVGGALLLLLAYRQFFANRK